MTNNITFLITYYAHPELLKTCITSIRKFYPSAPIVVSQQYDDDAIEVEDFTLIHHNMRQQIDWAWRPNGRSEAGWAVAAQGLMKACTTPIGVFLEHDCVLLNPLDDLLPLLDTYDMIGPEDVIPNLRDSPGFICQNFFILHVERFIKNHGIDAVVVTPDGLYDGPWRPGLYPVVIESGYGISQHSKKYFLPVKQSGYAQGTFYGQYAHHLWYGSYRKRHLTQCNDFMTNDVMENETQRFISNFNQGLITI